MRFIYDIGKKEGERKGGEKEKSSASKKKTPKEEFTARGKLNTLGSKLKAINWTTGTSM